jgi:hypothetical protein
MIPYNGADRAGSDVADGFWGSSYNPNRSHFGGPAILYAAALVQNIGVAGSLQSSHNQTQGQGAAKSPPPVDSSLAGSPSFVQENPIAAGVQIYVPEPGFVNGDYFNGSYHVGILSYAVITVVDRDGVPIDGPLMIQEQVSGQNQPIEQNPNFEKVENGFIGRIGLTAALPRPVPQDQADQQQGYMATTHLTDTATQTLAIATPGRGVVLTVVSDRITTNSSPVRVNARGIPVPNYSVNVSIRSVTSNVRSP